MTKAVVVFNSSQAGEGIYIVEVSPYRKKKPFKEVIREPRMLVHLIQTKERQPMAYWGHCRQTSRNKEAEAERTPPAALKLWIDHNERGKHSKGNYL